MTEAASLDDPELVMDIFTRLRVKGVGLSLDDFGTGTSSLTQLYKMPFSEVKIDGSVISEITTTKAAATIVRAIIDLAHNLSLTVCARRHRDAGRVRVPRPERAATRCRATSSPRRCRPAEIENFIQVWNGADHTLVPVMRK